MKLTRSCQTQKSVRSMTSWVRTGKLVPSSHLRPVGRPAGEPIFGISAISSAPAVKLVSAISSKTYSAGAPAPRAGAAPRFGARARRLMPKSRLRSKRRITASPGASASKRPNLVPVVAEPAPKTAERVPRAAVRVLMRRPKSLEVTIPPGVHDGSIIRLAGQGEPGIKGRPSGDLRLHVRLEPHPLFHVTEGGELEVELPVAPWEAALGASVPVPTLDGTVEMTVPAGTQGGRRLRLRGQGLNRRRGGRSDLYVKIKMMIPPRLTSKERELLEKLATESRFDARLLPVRR